jgi:short-subunit dehydrogenase
MRQLRDRVAVVTGAGNGIGRGVGEALARRGCHLALVDCDAGALRETAAQLHGLGRRTSTHLVDVADREQMAALPAAVLAEHGGVHLLVNNAGVSLAGPLLDLSLDDFAWIVGVNFWGVVHGCRFFLPHLLRQEAAHIVNVLSDFALIGFPTKTGYCATKFAARGFSESLSSELHGTRVGLTAVYPGAVATGIARRGRAWDAAKQELEARFLEKQGLPVARVAGAIVAGVERNRARVLIGRETHAIDWMKRLFPVGTDALVARFRNRIPFA